MADAINEIENKFLKPNEAEWFLKNNPTWRYGQKFVHRSYTQTEKRKLHLQKLNSTHNPKNKHNKGMKLNLSEEEHNKRREHCRRIGKLNKGKHKNK